MQKYILILCMLFLACCAKQHGNGTQTGTANASPDENDKTKPLMIGGKQFINTRYDLEEGSPERRNAFTLGDNIDDILYLSFDIDPLDGSKMNSLEGIEQLYNAQNLVSIGISGRNLDTVDLSPLERFTNITAITLRIRGSSRLLPDLSAFKFLRKLVISLARFEQPYTLNVPPGLTSLNLDRVSGLHNVDLSVIETLHDLHRLRIVGDIVKLPDLTKLENLRIITMGSIYDGAESALESLEGIGAPNAEEIRITSSREINSLAPLDNLLNLEHLEISSPWEGECNLENLPSLKYLKLTEISMDGKVNLHGIVNLPNLRHLEIGIFGKIDLQDIEKLQSLEYLNIYYSEDVSIEGIGK